MAQTPVRNDFSRVFLMSGGAGPATVPQYMLLARAGAPAWPQGDVTLTRIPDPDRYGQFIVIDKVPGEQGLPSITITSRYNTDMSEFLRLARQGCDSDLQIHFGKCQNPRDFNNGWDKILHLSAARVTNWTTNDMGALEPGDRATVTEEAPFQGEDLYEIKRISFSDQAAAQAVLEALDVAVCDSQTCGECGIPSNGCNVVFVLTRSSSASPGLVAELLYTADGGATWGDIDITSLAAAEDPNALACAGTNVVVVSATEPVGLHYAPISEIVDGDDSATWAKVTTGFAASGGPRAIWSQSPAFTWIVGDGGYIYFSADPTNGVVVQDAGSATVQQLNAVHGSDSLNVVAVGNNNAVVATDNGGVTWQSITGPAVGVNLTTVAVLDENRWFVGAANGNLYYTTNGGVTWATKSFPGSGAGSVGHIRFATGAVGYMTHTTVAPAGRMLRTIDGGNSWYVLPEGTGTIPTNVQLNKVATCTDPNVVYAAGLREAGAQGDGIVLKGA